MLFIDPLLIKTHEKFKKAFLINDAVLSAMVENMKTHGFDKAFPLIVWKEKGVLVDGHTRRQAAIEAGVPRVPYIAVSAANEAEVMRYIKHVQYGRRNAGDADKLRTLLDDPELPLASNKKLYIAQTLNISPRTAVKFINIMKDPKEIERVLKGDEDEPKEKAEVKEKTDLYLTHAKRLLKTLPESLDSEGRKVLRELHLKIGRVLRG